MSEITPQPPGDGDLTPVPAPPVLVPGPNVPPAPRTDDQKGTWPRWVGYKNARDLLLGILGATLMVYEVMFADEINTLIVATAAGLLGAPVVLRTDEKSK